MSIRKKLIISNILIIVIPVAIAIATLTIFTAGPGGQTWETMENLFDDEDGIYTAQSEMQTLEWRGDLKGVKKEMKNAGYHFMITYGGKVWFSNITKEDTAAAEKALGSLYNSTGNLTFTKGTTSVVRYDSTEENFKTLAIHTKNISSARGYLSYMERYIILYIGFLIAIIIAGVVLMNVIMSWWIAKNILRPMKKLSIGSELIREGNLDFEMTYPKHDEIGQVINDFDGMRKYLKESVTERMKYEQYRRELINGISHDLRTPLTSIKGYVTGLHDGIASTAEMKLRYYEAIETSIATLEDLVDDLTNFSKVEMGESHLDMKPTDLFAYYRGQLGELSKEYVKDDVTITFDISEGTAVAMIDTKAMDRINRNLIDNTIKYRKKDSSNVSISIDVNDSDTAEIRIKDDGPGVEKKDLEKIFTCFYRGDESRTRSADGSGIGLAVVKQLICQQGGTVHAENDDGLVIVMDIPLYKEEADA